MYTTCDVHFYATCIFLNVNAQHTEKALRAQNVLISLRRSRLAAWVQRIAQAIADQVEGQHSHHDGDAGED